MICFFTEEEKIGLSNIDSVTNKRKQILLFWKLGIKNNLFSWFKKELRKMNYEKEEIESEYYLLCAELIIGYKRSKGLFLNYLQYQSYWHINNFLKKISQKCKDILIPLENQYIEIKEEYYYDLNKILFEKKYLGNLTNTNKYIIYTILVSEKNELTVSSLGRKLNITRETMRSLLKDLKNLTRS